MSENKKIIAFLIIVMFIQTVFLLIPSDGARVTHNLFFLSSAECSYQEYVYYLLEHMAWCYVFLLMESEIDRLKKPLFCFFVLSIADFVDFFLTYNSVWGYIGNVPISFNVVNMIGLLFIFFSTNDDGK